MAKSKKTEWLHVRLSPEDKAAIVKAAKGADMTPSEFIRAATLAYLALKMDPHALWSVLEGAKNMLVEFQEEGKRAFFAKKLRA